MVWMTATEALGLLNVRPQTLYANVSRGKIRAKPTTPIRAAASTIATMCCAWPRATAAAG
jgi:hypothetical protein